MSLSAFLSSGESLSANSPMASYFSLRFKTLSYSKSLSFIFFIPPAALCRVAPVSSAISEKEKSIYEKLWFRIFAVVTVVAIATGIGLIINRRKMEELIEKQKKDRKLIREMSEAFAKVIDIKDNYTKNHSKNVADYTVKLAQEMLKGGELKPGKNQTEEDLLEQYYCIALLHDIGKITIPHSVLNKPGKLDDNEFAMIKSHSGKGYDILRDIESVPDLAFGAYEHHERPDGRGYPRGLKENEISRVAQVIAVADTFDAMYSDRPYRKRMNFEKAVSIIKEVSGTQLTEDVVDAFLRLVDRGFFKAEDDDGGGSTEDINNIHKKQAKE